MALSRAHSSSSLESYWRFLLNRCFCVVVQVVEVEEEAVVAMAEAAEEDSETAEEVALTQLHCICRLCARWSPVDRLRGALCCLFACLGGGQAGFVDQQGCCRSCYARVCP